MPAYSHVSTKAVLNTRITSYGCSYTCIYINTLGGYIPEKHMHLGGTYGRVPHTHRADARSDTLTGQPRHIHATSIGEFPAHIHRVDCGLCPSSMGKDHARGTPENGTPCADPPWVRTQRYTQRAPGTPHYPSHTNGTGTVFIC